MNPRKILDIGRMIVIALLAYALVVIPFSWLEKQWQCENYVSK